MSSHNNVSVARNPWPESPELRERDLRLDALRALVIRLAHDFNNHLAPVLGWFSLIKEDATLTPRIHQYATTGENAARATESDLDSILNAVRPERRFQPVPTDLTAILQECIKDWRSHHTSSVKILVQTDLLPTRLFADPNHWNKVFTQALSNVRFALALGGTVNISIKKRDLTDTEVRYFGVSVSKGFLISFKDNGIGMSEATLHRACEPFFSTRPKNAAHGLGLTLMHSVVRLHGGQMTLASIEGEGTTLEIWLPAELPPVSTAGDRINITKSEVCENNGCPAGTKILLVDDDSMVREVVKAIVERDGATVVVAQNGEEGLKMLRRYQTTINLIITDIAMPVMDGIQFVSKLKELECPHPIIVFSGEGDDVFIRARSTWGDIKLAGIVKKPCSAVDIRNAVRQVANIKK